MKIETVELVRIAMPLVAPFRTSFGTQFERDILLVHVVGPEAEGWGECVALTDPLYSPEYVEGAQALMRRFILPRLASLPEVRAQQIGEVLSVIKGNPMAKAAVEMAVLDAELSGCGVSLGSHLGAVRESVACGVSVGIAGSIPELLEIVASYLDEGYVRIKLKIEPGWDFEPVRAVRERFGEEILLQVDANCAYGIADSRQLARLDPFDLLLIEQPFDEGDIAGHAALARLIETPVCLDESITSARSAADAIARGACSIVNIKAGRVGGYLEARAVHDVCTAHGVPVWCGGMLETGIGRAANLALAALPGFLLPGDISATSRYFSEDITAPFVLRDGQIDVPRGPGLGVEVIEATLEALTSETEVIRI